MIKAWLCVPKDITKPEDVNIVYASNRKEVLDQLADRYNDENLKEYVEDTSTNMSLAEKFFKDDKGNMFVCYGQFGVREDIVKMFNFNRVMIEAYVDYWFSKRVKEFFYRQPKFGELYLKYWHGDDVEFPREMYWYCARYNEGWISWEIREIECMNCDDEVVTA